MQAMQQRAAPRIRVGDYFVSDLHGNLQGTLPSVVVLRTEGLRSISVPFTLSMR